MADPSLSTGAPGEVIAKRSRFVVMAGWQDVPHLTAEMIAKVAGRGGVLDEPR